MTVYKFKLGDHENFKWAITTCTKFEVSNLVLIL